jgi:pimeloyl-ACP methyl ester carboxylesterase
MVQPMATRARNLAPSIFALGFCVAGGMVACSSEYNRGPVAIAEADAGVDSGPSFTNPGSLKCGATEAEIYGDPGDLSKFAVGDVIKCKDDGIFTAAQIKSDLMAVRKEEVINLGQPDQTSFVNTYKGRDPVTDSHVYRVLYKTTRANGTPAGAPGFSVATIFLPVKPVAEKLPLVLVARGSRGQAPGCAISKITRPPTVVRGENIDNKDGSLVDDDFVALTYPLVGAGYAVVATDNAGYSPFNYGKGSNLPSGYAYLDDVARSYLDSARPLKAALGAASNDKLVLVGMSQGSHTALGSMQVANTYPIPGPIVAVAAYAPLWYTQRSWGVTLNPLSISVAGVLLNKSAGVPGAIWYHYTQAELADGVGEGAKLFKPAVRDAVKKFVETTCWSRGYRGLADALPAGAQGSSADFFSDEMGAALGANGLVFQKNCSDSPNATLCNKWLDRYKADHPVHTGAAQEIPILLGYGLQDQTIPKARFACVVDKLKQGRSAAQFAKVEYCLNGGAGHAGSALLESDYVNEWIKAKVYGTAAPAPNPTACPETTWDSTTACDSLLPND